MEELFDNNLQVDEIEVMRSIYGNEWKENGSDRSFVMTIEGGHSSVDFYVTLPEKYPQEVPPVYSLLAPNLSREAKLSLSVLLDEVYLDYLGQPVLYAWVEKIREFIVGSNEKEEMSNKEDSDANDLVASIASSLNIDTPEVASRNIEIVHGELIIDRKSTFQGHVASVTSVQDVRYVIETLLQNRKIENATHNIKAHRIMNEEKDNVCIQDCDDDGESQAGGRLLHLLQLLNVSNVLVVVSRWYGGIQLGPDRFKHINNAARQVLEQAGLIPTANTQNKKKK